MPGGIGPLGRGGARRRTRRRMTAAEEMSQEQGQAEGPEQVASPEQSNKLEKLAQLLKDKGVITEEEFNMIFG